LEISTATHPSLRFAGPIGLDGLYRKGAPTVSGAIAVKGTWTNGNTFVADIQYIGTGEQQEQWSPTFDGERLNLRLKDRQGHEVSIDGKLGG
jgi:hypothetical protein